MKKTIISITAIAALSACATSPEAIAPVAMGDIYSNKSCAEAATMRNAEVNNLAALSAQQNKARDSDTIGVILIGLPVSSMSGGDVEGQVGVSKGKIQALNARLANC